MEKVAVIGPKNIVLGLKAFGIDVFIAVSSQEALTNLKELKNQGKHSVIFVIKELLDGIPKDDYKKIQSEHLPVILAIPGLNADDKGYLDKLRTLAEKAVGSDILK